MTEEKIRKEFIEAAINHNLSILQGDAHKANKFHKKIIKLYQEAKRIEKQNLFLDYLDHSNDGVRLWAATSSLKSNPKAAIDCLNKLMELPTITSMDAKMILNLWNKGELELL